MTNYVIYFKGGHKEMTAAKTRTEAEVKMAVKYPDKEVFNSRVGTMADVDYIYDKAVGAWLPNPKLYPMKKITDKIFGNFGSPEELKFLDGSIIPGVDPLRAKELLPLIKDGSSYTGGDTDIVIGISEKAEDVVDMWIELHDAGEVDYVLVPIQYYYILRHEMLILKDNPFRIPKAYDEGITSYGKFIV